MKRIACLGTLIASPGKNSGTLPSNIIIEFYNDIRFFCRDNSVPHIFILRQQTFLLVMEGEAQDLACLTRLLNADHRVIDLSVISHQQIGQVELTGSRIKVIRSGCGLEQKLRDRVGKLLDDHIELKKPFDQRRLDQILASQAGSEMTSFPSN